MYTVQLFTPLYYTQPQEYTIQIMSESLVQTFWVDKSPEDIDRLKRAAEEVGGVTLVTFEVTSGTSQRVVDKINEHYFLGYTRMGITFSDEDLARHYAHEAREHPEGWFAVEIHAQSRKRLGRFAKVAMELTQTTVGADDNA